MLYTVKTKTTKPTDSINAWLLHPGAVQYFGKATVLKMDVLACLLTGGNLADVARRHGVTRAAASKQARAAKQAYGKLGNS